MKEHSLSDTEIPERRLPAAGSPPDTCSGPSIHKKTITLEVLTLVPPPQRLSDAEIPLWKVLEERSGKDTSETNSAGDDTEPLCRG